MREAWVTTSRIGDTCVSVPISAITAGPSVVWGHMDGPLMSWASELHWLTPGERICLRFHRTTIDEIACSRWPHLAALRAEHTGEPQ